MIAELGPTLPGYQIGLDHNVGYSGRDVAH